MKTLAALAFALVLATGCKKDYPQCEQFVDLAMKCDDDLKTSPAEERKMAKVMLGGMCEEAFKNDTSSVEGETKQMVTEMYSELRTRANCASKANTCDQYASCTD